MKTRFITSTLLCFSLIHTGIASAEYVGPWSSLSLPPSFANTPPMAPEHHASTVAQGWLYGKAALEQALANAELQGAEANLLNERARAFAYGNKLLSTQTYLANKIILEEYRRLKLQDRLTHRKWLQKCREERNKELAETYRLNESELSLEFGRITWPEILVCKRYESYRIRLEQLFQQLADNGTRSDRAYRHHIVRTCSTFKDKLARDYFAAVSKGHKPSRQQYYALQKFLTGLKYAPELI